MTVLTTLRYPSLATLGTEEGVMRSSGCRRPGGMVGVALTGVLAAALAGCADEASPGATASSGAYGCLGTPIPIDAVASPRPATELDEDTRAALRGIDVPDIDPADWTVASASPAEVVLLRELVEADDHGAGDLRTHERMTISVVDAPNIPDSPAWMMTALGTCALSVDVPGAEPATVTLNPAQPPVPHESTVALLVTERACNSGEDAAGRIDVASLRETDTTVAVVIAVRPRGGDQTCPSNPATPFTLTLDEPLGARQLIDISVAPPRPITMPTG